MDQFWMQINISVMLAPIDLAYPIRLKLEGIEDNIEFDELFAPSIAFSVGMTDLPVSYGLGYQRGAQIAGTNESENKVFLFVAFDMPLWNIW